MCRYGNKKRGKNGDDSIPMKRSESVHSWKVYINYMELIIYVNVL